MMDGPYCCIYSLAHALRVSVDDVKESVRLLTGRPLEDGQHIVELQMVAIHYGYKPMFFYNDNTLATRAGDVKIRPLDYAMLADCFNLRGVFFTEHHAISGFLTREPWFPHPQVWQTLDPATDKVERIGWADLNRFEAIMFLCR